MTDKQQHRSNTSAECPNSPLVQLPDLPRSECSVLAFLTEWGRVKGVGMRCFAVVGGLGQRRAKGRGQHGAPAARSARRNGVDAVPGRRRIREAASAFLYRVVSSLQYRWSWRGQPVVAGHSFATLVVRSA
jgi:hypothetical protein